MFLWIEIAHISKMEVSQNYLARMNFRFYSNHSISVFFVSLFTCCHHFSQCVAHFPPLLLFLLSFPLRFFRYHLVFCLIRPFPPVVSCPVPPFCSNVQPMRNSMQLSKWQRNPSERKRRWAKIGNRQGITKANAAKLKTKAATNKKRGIKVEGWEERGLWNKGGEQQ